MTRTYKGVVDRTGWEPGPWDNEPEDKVQWTDKRTGMACMMLRNPSGVWCGYVGVNQNHPAYKMGYHDAQEKWPTIQVHGGLTYSNLCDEGPEESSICHVPEPGEPDGVWWLGFDCWHWLDIAPANVKWERETGVYTRAPTVGLDVYHREYCSLKYVKREVVKLARQLDKIGKSPILAICGQCGRQWRHGEGVPEQCPCEAA